MGEAQYDGDNLDPIYSEGLDDDGMKRLPMDIVVAHWSLLILKTKLTPKASKGDDQLHTNVFHMTSAVGESQVPSHYR